MQVNSGNAMFSEKKKDKWQKDFIYYNILKNKQN